MSRGPESAVRSVRAPSREAVQRATITRVSVTAETTRALRSTTLRLLLAALLFAAFAAWAFLSVDDVLKRQMSSELETQRESSRAAIEIWAESILSRLDAATGTPEIAGALGSDGLPSALEALVAQTDSVGALVTDAEGVIVRASPEFTTGRALPYSPRELRAWLLEPQARLWSPAFFPTARGARPLFTFSAPLRAAGAAVGAVHLLVDPAGRFSEILSLGRLGRSGETFAFDREARMISGSRFTDELVAAGLVDERTRSVILALDVRDPGVSLADGAAPEQPRSQLPLTHMARAALSAGRGTNVDGYRDYRGVPTVGSWDYLPRYGIGLTTKIDVDEAFELRRALGHVLVVLLALLVATLLFLVWEGYRNVQLSARSLRAERKAERLGQYTLGRKLGEGGMGAVYEASHAMLRRPTAVKLIKSSDSAPLTSERFSRFEREVQLTAQLTHPNTIAIYDYGKTPDGVLYYAMEYLSGVDLEKLVARAGPLSPARASYLIQQACGSLAEAHERGFIHRDVKPSNLMACERGGEFDFLKVLDFGLVKSTSSGAGASSVTLAGALAGTPHYMSPESLSTPELAKSAADVYALGAVLYFLISGRDLFPGREAMAVMVAQISEEPPRIETLVPSIPPAAADLIHRCLRKKPEERPASARELARALRETFPNDWDTDAARQWWLAHPQLVHPELEIEGAANDAIDPTGETMILQQA